MLSTVFRYDLANSNVNDPNLEALPESSRPDVVIVKKVFGEKSLRNRRRKWRLRHMEGLHGAQVDTASQNNDYNDFLEVRIKVGLISVCFSCSRCKADHACNFVH